MWLNALVNLVLGAVCWFWGGRQQTEGEAQGRAEQRADDLAATVAADRGQAKVSHEIDKTVAGDSDPALDAGLREFEAGSGSPGR